MRRIQHPTYPEWPALYQDERTHSLIVEGKHKTLDGSKLLGCLSIPALLVWMVVSFYLLGLISDNPIIVIGLWFVGFVGFLCLTGSISSGWPTTTRVVFTPDRIVVPAKKGTESLAFREDIEFRIRPHRKLALNAKLTQKEHDQLQNFGEIVMEYGQRTIAICGIADIEKADYFCRMLIEAAAATIARTTIAREQSPIAPPPISPPALPE